MLMVQDLLRSRFSLLYFANLNISFATVWEKVTRKGWEQAAEFEAILRPSFNLCFFVQGDRPEIAAELLLYLTTLKAGFSKQVYSVVDVNAQGKQQWMASKPFDLLPKVNVATNIEKSIRSGIRVMTEPSLELIERLKKAFEEYFEKLNDDRLR